MKESEFGEQIDELKEVFGKKFYPDQRVKRFFQAFKYLSVNDFSLVVDHLITHERVAPMQNKIQEAVDTLQRNQKESRRMPGTNLSLDNLPTGKADPEFVKLCRKTLHDFQRGRVSTAKLFKNCDALDRLAEQVHKCKVIPGPGFK